MSHEIGGLFPVCGIASCGLEEHLASLFDLVPSPPAEGRERERERGALKPWLARLASREHLQLLLSTLRRDPRIQKAYQKNSSPSARPCLCGTRTMCCSRDSIPRPQRPSRGLLPHAHFQPRPRNRGRGRWHSTNPDAPQRSECPGGKKVRSARFLRIGRGSARGLFGGVFRFGCFFFSLALRWKARGSSALLLLARSRTRDGSARAADRR